MSHFKIAALALLAGLSAVPALAENVDSYGRATTRFDAASAGESSVNLGQPLPHPEARGTFAPRAGAPGSRSAALPNAPVVGHLSGTARTAQGPNYEFAYDR